MKIYAVRRIDDNVVREWSRDGDVIVLTKANGPNPQDAAYAMETVRLDLATARQITASKKNAYTLWSAKPSTDRNVEFINVFAQTYIDKTPAKQYLARDFSHAVLVVPTADDAILGISVSQNDDVSALGLDGDLTADQWSALAAGTFPKVTLEKTATEDGLTLTARVAKSGVPYPMQDVELYWESTSGLLALSRTPINVHTSENTLRDALPGARVKVGFRYFTGAADITV